MSVIGSAEPITITSENLVIGVKYDRVRVEGKRTSSTTDVTFVEHTPGKPATIAAGFYHAEDGSLVSYNLDLDAAITITPGYNRDQEVSREVEAHGFVYDRLIHKYVRESEREDIEHETFARIDAARK